MSGFPSEIKNYYKIMKSLKNIFSNNWARITSDVSDTTSVMNLLSYICSLCVSPLSQIHSLKRKCKINVLYFQLNLVKELR